MELLEKIKKMDLGEYGKCKKVVLAYSGGLDTSVLLKLLQGIGLDVVTVTLDFGQDEYAQQALEQVKKKAEHFGAVKAFVIDAKQEFLKGYVNKGIQANCLYEGYPCSTALGRPLVAKYLVKIAKQEKADAVAHGSTGKGNDYLRFHVSVKAMCDELKVLTPVIDWQLDRAEEIEYACKEGIPVPVSGENPYSIDANLWGRSVEGGAIECEYQAVPEDALEWVVPPEKAPDSAAFVKLFFSKGIPIKAEFAGKTVEDEFTIVHELNKFAGGHGVGVIDHIEDRTIGLKSREFYECPAATVILKAHKDLELLCLNKEVNALKPMMDHIFAQYCYTALWDSPAMKATYAFIEESQENVDGWVLMKLFKGQATVVARKSQTGLYSKALATYGKSSFNQMDSKGFANLYALSTVNACKNMHNQETCEG